MLDMKAQAQALELTAKNLTAALEERDMYQRLWSAETTKTTEQQKTIADQHAEIVRMNEELNALRETGTIIVHDKAKSEEEA